MNDIIEQIITIGKGAFITLELLFGSFSLGLVLAIFIAVLRYQGIAVWILDKFVSVLRGTPLILQLSFMHFVLPSLVGIKFSIITTGIITFGINSSAYVAEILRGGIESLPKGQFEASKTLYIPKYYMWKDIILPQVITNVLPTLINELIALLKETAIISVIGGMDIMRQSDLIAAEKFDYFMPLCIAGVYYYVFVLIIEFFGRKLESRRIGC